MWLLCGAHSWPPPAQPQRAAHLQRLNPQHLGGPLRRHEGRPAGHGGLEGHPLCLGGKAPAQRKCTGLNCGSMTRKGSRKAGEAAFASIVPLRGSHAHRDRHCGLRCRVEDAPNNSISQTTLRHAWASQVIAPISQEVRELSQCYNDAPPCQAPLCPLPAPGSPFLTWERLGQNGRL